MRLLSLVGSLLFLASSPVFAAAPDNAVLSDYLRIQESLASDTLDGVVASAAAIAKNSHGEMAKAAKELSQAKTLQEARSRFKKLSGPVVKWVKETNPADVEVVHCSMAKASWAQKKGQVRNPYYGKEMLECGDKAS